MPETGSVDWAGGLKQGLLIGAAVLVIVLPQGPAPRPAATRLDPAELEFGSAYASPAARRLAHWIVATRDNGRVPFAILDKREARVYVFGREGRLRGASPVLLGSARGDDTVPGIGQRPIHAVRPDERTTPAGRFVASPGRNAHNEDVVWVDYAAAVSMHRVRLTQPAEHRLERLASPRARDRRISYGCINLPAAFFDDVVWPRFAAGGGVVYVLPEIKSIHMAFPALRRFEARAGGAPAQGTETVGSASIESSPASMFESSLGRTH